MKCRCPQIVLSNRLECYNKTDIRGKKAKTKKKNYGEENTGLKKKFLEVTNTVVEKSFELWHIPLSSTHNPTTIHLKFKLYVSRLLIDHTNSTVQISSVYLSVCVCVNFCSAYFFFFSPRLCMCVFKLLSTPQNI